MGKNTTENSKKLYKTYIFDYYGTLVDIKTDESKPELWNHLAGIYSAYGADYTPEELQKKYSELCEAEEAHLRKILKVWEPNMELEYPEILLERVFARLLTEAENHHETAATIEGKPVRLLSADDIADSEWAYMVSNTFRIISREWYRCYPNTISTLKTLKENGCKLYLLSNAQGIFTRTELEMAGVLPYLDGVYISSDKQIKKPQPEFMEKLIKEFDIDRESAVMVGNEMKCDMGIAAACGLPGVFLNTFGWSDKKIEEEMKKINVTTKNVRVVADGDIAHLLD